MRGLLSTQGREVDYLGFELRSDCIDCSLPNIYIYIFFIVSLVSNRSLGASSSLRLY